MKRARALVFRYLTEADFFNIYKPPGTETGGGGQLYIDFLTSTIPIKRWHSFFAGVTDLLQTEVHNGPQWEFPVHSIGLPDTQPLQKLRIYQRRAASICIPNQNMNTRSANRVRAWHPANGFPQPTNPLKRNALPPGLAVYLVRTYDRTVWAGWFSNHISDPSPCQDNGSSRLLEEMLTRESEPGHVGFMAFAQDSLLIDETNPTAPFFTRVPEYSLRPRVVVTSLARTLHRPPKQRMPERGGGSRVPRQRRERTEEEIIERLFGEDDDRAAAPDPATTEVAVKIRRRNQNAAADLKELYGHRCQISGDQFSFLKRNGRPYTEVHHLIPLGEGGADDPRNMIVVNPLIHRMLHYARVSGVDLSRIQARPDGSASLSIEINGQTYTITWKAQHADRVLRHGEDG